MSWSPTFYIKRDDFHKVLSDLLHIKDDHHIYCYAFEIESFDGVVISGGDISSTNRDIHDLIRDFDHWILNGEGACCDDVHEWEDKLL